MRSSTCWPGVSSSALLQVQTQIVECPHSHNIRNADLFVGACGTLFGATSSIIRGVKTPVLFSLVSGLQWFGIGSVFYGTIYPSPGRITVLEPR